MKTFIFTAAALALAAASGAHANSFGNGDFSSNTGNGQVSDNTTVTDWYVPSGGYSFLFSNGSIDTSGANGEYGGLSLWGFNNGGHDTLPNVPGGWAIAIDGDFQQQPLNQDVTGLSAGKTYTVGFNYAYAQQTGFYGDTIQSLTVNLGSDPTTARSTPALTNPSQNFTGFMQDSFSFVATSSAETLSFVANGNLPIPPFALVSNVTFTPDAVPEPATWTMMLLGVAGMGVAARRRRAVISAA